MQYTKEEIKNVRDAWESLSAKEKALLCETVLEGYAAMTLLEAEKKETVN